MKKLLIQLDTDPHPAVFDTVVAYDGGADHVIAHGHCTPDNVRPLVEGAIFTRKPREKKNTALFIGGSDMNRGEALFEAVLNLFFDDFRVSVMLDSNGSNTTAAAAVARILHSAGSVRGKRAVILAGTGPVGQRAAIMLAREGAQVAITSRDPDRAREVCQRIKQQTNLDIEPLQAATGSDRAKLAATARILLATGAGGARLLDEAGWRNNPDLEVVLDANASPPAGIEGVNMLDRGEKRHGKLCWGAIGFGSLKLTLHRACIARLFQDTRQILDTKEIFAQAKMML